MNPRLRRAALILTVLAAALTSGGTASAREPGCSGLERGPCVDFGTAQPLGDGQVRTYAELDRGRPLAVGVLFGRGTMSGLPTEMTDRHHCYDLNGDGRIDEATECAGGHEQFLDLPPALLRLSGSPFRWVLFNWDPMGHGPAGIYDRAHFDTHFYLVPKAERDAIRLGPCGILMNCEDFARATKPVPPEFLPADHADLGLAEVAMGNHLPDLASHEWHGVPFDRTFIYGAYDGLITFLEPMVTYTTMRRAESAPADPACLPVKQPLFRRRPGWYPRSYCVRYLPENGQYTVSLEDFALGEAHPISSTGFTTSPPAAAAAASSIRSKG